jgi:Plasmid pRiA4b ORF-3-like protein
MGITGGNVMRPVACAITALGVTGRDSDPAELHRQFEEIIAGMDVDDLKELSVKLLSLPGSVPARSEQRPSLRKPRRSDAAIFRVRVDLEHATPPIWRRLDVRADIGLDVFHHVLQRAFGWTDSHLTASPLAVVPSIRTPNCSCVRTTPKRAKTTVRPPKM